MSHDLSAAQQLLGGYLHQDWPDEFADVDAVIDAMIDGEPAEQRRAAAAELRALVEAEPEDAALRDVLMNEAGCFYDPVADGRTDREWITELADRLSA